MLHICNKLKKTPPTKNIKLRGKSDNKIFNNTIEVLLLLTYQAKNCIKKANVCHQQKMLFVTKTEFFKKFSEAMIQLFSVCLKICLKCISVVKNFS